MMQRLEAGIAAICMADSKAGLVSALGTALVPFGLHTFNLSINKAHQREFMITPTLTSWRSEDLDNYAREQWADRDPLLERSVQPGLKEIWFPRDWASARKTAAYAEYISGEGIHGGASTTMPARPGTVSAMTALCLAPDGRIDPQAPTALAILGHCAIARAGVLGLDGPDLPALSSRFNELSGRQREILAWASKGKSNADIAAIMGLTPRNVHYHVSEILRKLHLNSRVQAAALFAGKDR